MIINPEQFVPVNPGTDNLDKNFVIGKSLFLQANQKSLLAFDYFFKARNLGHPKALSRLEWYYKAGHVVEESKANQHQLGFEKRLFDKQPISAEAQNNYSKGDRLHQESIDLYKRSMTALEKVSCPRHQQAPNIRGHLYLKGLGVAQEPEKALFCFNLSASRGYVLGLHNVGFVLKEIEGSRRDTELAVQCFERAAKENCLPSRIELIECYGKGIGTEQNTPAAVGTAVRVVITPERLQLGEDSKNKKFRRYAATFVGRAFSAAEEILLRQDGVFLLDKRLFLAFDKKLKSQHHELEPISSDSINIMLESISLKSLGETPVKIAAAVFPPPRLS